MSDELREILADKRTSFSDPDWRILLFRQLGELNDEYLVEMLRLVWTETACRLVGQPSTASVEVLDEGYKETLKLMKESL